MKSIFILTFLSLSVLFTGCVTAPPPVVQVPADLVVVTQQQKDLVQGLRTLSVGDSRETVKARLGAPVMSNNTTWFYEFQEDMLRGGHYVSAKLDFDANGLKTGMVHGGYSQRMRPQPLKK